MMRLSLTTRIAAGVMVLVALAVSLGTLNLYLSLRGEMYALLGERIAGAARLAAAQISAADMAAIPAAADADAAALQRPRDALTAAQRAYNLTWPVALLRPTPVEGQLEYIISTADTEPQLGDLYLAEDDVLYALLAREVMYTEPRAHGALRWMSAWAPILAADGTVAGVVKVDHDVDAYVGGLGARMAWTALFSCSVALLGGALGVLFARRLARPIRQLAAATHRVEAGDYTVQVAVQGRDEIATLATAFNAMVEGLRERDRVKAVMGKYFAPQVAHRLLDLANALHLEGERREVTVLVSDIRNYTAMAAGTDPEALVHALNAYFGALVDVVLAHEGTVDKFMGDGLLVYFGAPLPQEDHRRRALDCAREMQRVLATFNGEREAQGLLPLRTGIGLAAGEVLLGNIGSEKHLEYTIIGEAVNLATRLCGEAPGDHVLAASAVLTGLEDRFHVTRLPPVEVKGFRDPVPVADVPIADA